MNRHCFGIMKNLVLVITLFFVASPVFAVDGVIEINQAKALAGGVTPGDPPGFPAVINSSGSYVLTSNLTVTSANTTVIDIRVDNVSVDLNGFSIIGPFTCTGSPPSCSGGPFAGRGIEASDKNMTVFNGSVTGMGNDGISVGENSRVERVHARCNCGNGIFASDGSIVMDSTARHNKDNGVAVGNNSSVKGNIVINNGNEGVGAGNIVSVISNTAIANGSHGIRTRAESSIRGNTVSGNTGFGLDVSTSGYADNVINSNTGGTVSGGIQMGTNVCNGNTTCP